MEIPGEVQNGVVVLKGDLVLPDGTQVVVSVRSEPETRQTRRVKLPLVRSKTPGQLKLTNDMIAEYLNDHEISR